MKRPPFLHHEHNRHGKLSWYFRRGNGPRTRLRAPYGTEEFMDEYTAALAKEVATKARTKAGTVKWLIDEYRKASAWSQLSMATRRQRENIFKHVVDRAGDKPFAAFTRNTVTVERERRKDTPAQANNFIKAMRGLFQWAMKNGHTKTDPTADVESLSVKTQGFHTWTEKEVQRFEAKWPLGTRERLAFDVLLYTGLRRGDAVRLGPAHVHDGIFAIVTEKTGHEVIAPILAPLQRSIDALPSKGPTFIETLAGEPWRKESFGNWFGETAKAAGVPGSCHGLRKAGATRAANNGATERELEAMFGWVGGKMAAHYTRKADRQRLAKGAMHKMESAEKSEVLPPVRQE